jgi:cytochrome c-type biogenesis protein CcmF
MMAEIGLALLWLAAGLTALQLLCAGMAFRAPAFVFARLTRPAAIMQAAAAGAAFAALVYLFAITDLSVELVVAHSHADKPLLYRLTGTWGNHEGSMLLWVAVMALSGGLIAAFERRLPERTMQAVLGTQAFVGIGFYAFLLASSNPFARIWPAPPTGAGLNPLLQDPGLAFHPPTLYVGYVGLSVAFSFAIGALLTRQVTPRFARVMRPWVLGAWVFLTLGIVAGSYWAYYELGWGGWWFWDPVENASLLPWLAATALLHSVSVLAARDALRTWTILLGVLAFSMSMLGTFLVRSGVLTSVHAFAVDPERGTFILALLGIYIGGALLIFGLRAGSVLEGERFSASSREGALVLNNVLLTAILAVVLLGTLYPLLTEALGTRVSVGPPYFDPVTTIFAVPLLLAMAVGPLLPWRKAGLDRIARPAMILGGGGVLLAVVLILATDIGLLPLIGLVLAAILAVGSFAPLRGRKLSRTPFNIWGMVLAHFGVAVALFGIAADSGFTQERLIAMAPGDRTSIAGYEVELEAVRPVAGPNWTALEARLQASRGQGTALLRPQSRTFFSPLQTTSESALLNRWNGQLYATIGEEVAGGRWQVRLWWKPFVTLIWLGGLLIALGGVASIFARVSHRRGASKATTVSKPEPALA